MWHVQTDIIQADKGVCDYFSVQAVDGEKGVPLAQFLKAIHSEDRPRVVNRITCAVMSGNPFNEVYRVITRMDGMRWIQAKGTCFRDESGRPTTYPGTIIDVTDITNEHPHTVVVENLMKAHEMANVADEPMLVRLIEVVLLEAGMRLATSLREQKDPAI